jgi:Leucine-rich repeat (LRR) protein
MKKHRCIRLLALALATLLLSAALPFSAAAADDISPAFTDEAFRMAVRASLQIAPNAPITAAQASTVTHLYAQNRGITSLAGIEHLTNLLVFDISSNALTGIDFSTNPSLIRVDVSGNPLATLNVQQNLNLTQLNAVATELTALDVTQNAKLSILYVPGNPQLSSLDLRYNPALSELNAAYCGLTALDITQNLNLIVLIASNNQLQSLTLGNQQVLQVLDVSDNQIAALNLSGLRDLVVLTAENNQLASLNTAQNLGLTYLVVSGNILTSLNVANQMLLSDLRANDNQISTLNISGNPLLQRLEAANNRISFLDLTQNEELVTLNVSGNRIPSIDLSKNFRIFSLDVSANQLTALDITELTRLRELDVSNNKLPSKQAITGLMESSLYTFVFDPQTPNGTDITSAFTDPNLLAALRSAIGLGANSPIMLEQAVLVTDLVLDGWGIENLNGLEHFTKLDSLSLANNSLTQLDMSMLPQLKELDVSGNQLTSLNITGNTALERLWAGDNRLEQLDLRKNPALRTLDVASNLLSALWLAENQALQNLNASRNLLQNLDLTNNTSIRVLDVRYNFMENESVILLGPGAFFTTWRFNPQNTLDMDVTGYFVDPAFLAAIRAALNKSAGEPVNAAELRTITELDISGQNIERLAGLSFLTNLERLDASNNRITSVDISNNIRLQVLDVRMNWMEGPAAVTGLRESITTEYYFAPQKLSGQNITALFPDENFLAALREAMGKGPDDPIGAIDAATTEALDLSNKGIADTTGLEHFTGLKTLSLADNPLQSLDLSRNTALVNLNVSGACLEALNLAANVALEQLDVSRNHLTALNLLASRNLKSLNATNNFLENQAVIRLPNPAPQTVQFNPQYNRVVTPATCTEASVATWTCGQDPAHILSAKQSDPLGHNWSSVKTPPTFTQGGYTTHTCKRCQESYTSDHLPAIKLEYQPTLALQYNQATSVFADVDRRAPDLTWRSSNTKVLTVDDNGLVKYARMGRGATTVTATDSNGIERVRVEVTVKIVWWQWLIIIFLFGFLWY